MRLQNAAEATRAHYDWLARIGDDPVHDPPALRAHMDEWDGLPFLAALGAAPDKTVLEIGVGSGRLAVRVCGQCRAFTGVDISENTLRLAARNLDNFSNVTLICGDFMTLPPGTLPDPFDIVYSSLTLMHLPDTAQALRRAAALTKLEGRLVLSVEKARRDFLESENGSRLRVYPDDPNTVKRQLADMGFDVTAVDRPRAVVLSAVKHRR